MPTLRPEERYVRIICTLGPASRDESMIVKMARRGMNVARLNFSHGNYKSHQQVIDLVRAANRKKDIQIGLLQDLEGYRIRIGNFKRNIPLAKNAIVYMANDAEAQDVIPLDMDDDLSSIKNGMHVYIDDGKLHLKVIAASKKKLKLKVILGGLLKERKGVNIPGRKLKANILTKKDKKGY